MNGQRWDSVRKLLEGTGFNVSYIASVKRPTTLSTAMKGWLAMFTKGITATLSQDQRTRFIDTVEQHLKPVLFSKELAT